MVFVCQPGAVSNPKQVQLSHSKNVSTPTSPTSPTSPAAPAGGAVAWPDNKGAEKKGLLTATSEVGKDFFNMKPWVICQLNLAQQSCTGNRHRAQDNKISQSFKRDRLNLCKHAEKNSSDPGHGCVASGMSGSRMLGPMGLVGCGVGFLCNRLVLARPLDV